MTPSEPENTCEGYCELWIEGKRIFKVNQGRNQRANAYSSVSIQKGAKIRREVTLTHTDFSIQPIFGIRHTIILTRNSAYNYFIYQGIVHTLKKLKLRIRHTAEKHS